MSGYLPVTSWLQEVDPLLLPGIEIHSSRKVKHSIKAVRRYRVVPYQLRGSGYVYSYNDYGLVIMPCVWKVPARIVTVITLCTTSDFIVNEAQLALKLSPQ